MTSTPGDTAASSTSNGAASLYEKAYVAIRDMLITAEIVPGAPINEDQLAKRLQIGRTPIREAMKRLEGERLTVIYPRRGIFATQVALNDLTLLTEVRRHLEGEAAFQAARRASHSERAVLNGLLSEGMDRSHETMAEIDFDNRVHRTIYRAAHNSYLENALQTYYNLTIRIWHVWTDRLPDMSSHVSELVPLLENVLDGDAERAQAIAVDHVSSFERAVAKFP